MNIYLQINELPIQQANVFKMKTSLNFATKTISNELNLTPSNL